MALTVYTADIYQKRATPVNFVIKNRTDILAVPDSVTLHFRLGSISSVLRKLE